MNAAFWGRVKWGIGETFTAMMCEKIETLLQEFSVPPERPSDVSIQNLVLVPTPPDSTTSSVETSSEGEKTYNVPVGFVPSKNEPHTTLAGKTLSTTVSAQIESLHTLAANFYVAFGFALPCLYCRRATAFFMESMSPHIWIPRVGMLRYWHALKSFVTVKLLRGPPIAFELYQSRIIRRRIDDETLCFDLFVLALNYRPGDAEKYITYIRGLCDITTYLCEKDESFNIAHRFVLLVRKIFEKKMGDTSPSQNKISKERVFKYILVSYNKTYGEYLKDKLSLCDAINRYRHVIADEEQKANPLEI